ncbi:MAG: histone deacetylase [Acidobacteria bacterium]|nr:histone deacetylase [Acidobacteriota bacterium]
MRICYSDRYIVPLASTHPFPMPKYRLVRDRLLSEGSITYRHLIEPPLAADEDILLVHTPDYWSRCVKGELMTQEVRRIGFPWSEALVRRSRASVQGTIMAAKNALCDGVASNLAGGTHHAYPDHGEGYCVLNDIAIATRVLQRDGLAERIAVIDCDVHQGNGTAVIFKGDPDVFTFSIHGEKNFPSVKEQSTLDINLSDGVRDEEYLSILARHIPQILSEFKPELVFYQAGVDPFEGDRLGKLSLTIEGLRRRDEFVISSCRERGIPVVTTMGGGYAKDINDTVEAHCNTVRVALRTVTNGKCIYC